MPIWKPAAHDGGAAASTVAGRLSLAQHVFAQHARDAEGGAAASGADADRALLDEYRAAGGIQHHRPADRENDVSPRRPPFSSQPAPHQAHPLPHSCLALLRLRRSTSAAAASA